eukprot:7637438-Pyramimonas_sp.AAC.1
MLRVPVADEPHEVGVRDVAECLAAAPQADAGEYHRGTSKGGAERPVRLPAAVSTCEELQRLVYVQELRFTRSLMPGPCLLEERQ